MIRAYLKWSAQRRLQKMVEANRKSIPVHEYRMRRAAAKLGWQRRKASDRLAGQS